MGWRAPDGNALLIFFILAGFVMGYRHNGEVIPHSLRDSFEFSRRRIGPKYPLHLALLLASMLLRFLYVIKERVPADSAPVFLVKLISNLTLTQSWLPSQVYYFAFNGVTWFLSCMTFLYFMTPLMLAALRRIKSLWLLGLAPLAFITVRVVAETLLSKAAPTEAYNCNPAFVLPLFYMGLAGGVLYARLLEIPSFRNARGLRAVVSTAAVLVYIGFNYLHWKLPVGIPGLGLLLMLLLIFGLAQECGPICWLLRNPVTVHLGDITFELYMVHQVLFAYIDALVEYLWRFEIYILQAQRNALRVILSLALAELVHWALPRINKKIRERRAARATAKQLSE